MSLAERHSTNEKTFFDAVDAEHERELAELSTRLERAVADREQIATALAASEDELAAARETVATVAGQLEHRTTERDQARAEATALRDDLAAAETKIGQLEAKITELQDLIDELEQTPPTTPPPTGFNGVIVIDAPRPTGAGYALIEDLGVGDDVRAAKRKAAAHGKVLSLDGRKYELNGFEEGAPAQKFGHGLLVHKNDAVRPAGLVGVGDATVLKIKAGTSRYKTNADVTTSQNLCLISIIQFYELGAEFRELGNFRVEGSDYTHFNMGVIVKGAKGGRMHHIRGVGAALGGWNMPPAENYTGAALDCDDLVMEDLEADGRWFNGQYWCSTPFGAIGSRNTIARRIVAHDTVSGFPFVDFESVGTKTEDVWGERMGLFAHGGNSAGINMELSSGAIRHVRPRIILDAYFGNIDNPKSAERPNGRRRVPIAQILDRLTTNPEARAKMQDYINRYASPANGLCDNMGKFGHITAWNTANRQAYRDTEIIDPIHDSWKVKGAFCITADPLDKGGVPLADMPKIIKAGRRLELVEIGWNQAPPAGFDPTRQAFVCRDSWG